MYKTIKSPYHQENLLATIVTPVLKSSCGETIVFYIDIKDNIIQSLSFTSSGSQLTLLSLHTLCLYAESKHRNVISFLSQEDILELLPILVRDLRIPEALAPWLLLQEILLKN